MRHVRSILYALVLAPAVWILCGVGFTEELTGRARDGGGFETLGAILLVVLAGLAYAILLFAPISPAGPASAGLVFLAVSGWALVNPDGYASLWPKDGFNLSRPGYALAAMLAVPLLCTALSARRWRRYEPPELPIIGTLGRPRGAAEPAAVITTADATEVLPHSYAAAPAPAVQEDEPTVVAPAVPIADEPTVVVAHGDDRPTADVPRSGGDSAEAGEESAAEEEPATLEATDESAEPTAVFAVDSNGEATTTVLSSAAPSEAEATADVAERDADVADAEATAAVPSAEATADVADADATAAVPSADTTADVADADATAAVPTAEATVDVADTEATVDVADATADIAKAEATADASDADATADIASAEATADAADADVADADVADADATPAEATADIAGAGEEPTKPIAVGDADEATVTMVGGDADAPSTDRLDGEQATVDDRAGDEVAEAVAELEEEPADEVTEAVADLDEEPTTALALGEAAEAAGEEDDDEEDAPAEEATVPIVDAADDADEPTVAAEAADDAEPTTVLRIGDEPAADDEATTVLRQPGEDTVDISAAREANDNEPSVTFVVPGQRRRSVAKPSVGSPEAEDGEKTQIIWLPRVDEVGEGPTRDFRGGGKTYLDGPGEQTQVIFRVEPVNDAAPDEAELRAEERAAQDRARQAFRDRAAQERARQAFADRAAAEARSRGDQTQVIRVPRRDDQAPPDDEAEHTEMLGRIPDEPKDETAPSIVGEERPDPGADPTTLLGRIPESPKPRPGKSMLHAERPPDETEDDTRMLIPKQRDGQDRAPVEET